ncbi:MAG: hypothetical protein ACKVOH_02580, partial [Chlamydiales bacterium]
MISFAAMALVGGLALCGVMRPDSIFKVMGDKFTQTGAIVVTTIGGLGAVTFVIIICIHQRRRQSACRQKAHDHVGDDAAPQPRQVIPGRVRGDAAPQPPRAAPDRFGDDGDDEAPDPRWAAPQPRQVIPGRVRGDAAPQPPRAAAAPDHFGDEAS